MVSACNERPVPTFADGPDQLVCECTHRASRSVSSLGSQLSIGMSVHELALSMSWTLFFLSSGTKGTFNKHASGKRMPNSFIHEDSDAVRSRPSARAPRRIDGVRLRRRVPAQHSSNCWYVVNDLRGFTSQARSNTLVARRRRHATTDVPRQQPRPVFANLQSTNSRETLCPAFGWATNVAGPKVEPICRARRSPARNPSDPPRRRIELFRHQAPLAARWRQQRDKSGPSPPFHPDEPFRYRG